MKVRVNYTCDFYSEDGMDQHGRVILEPESGGRVTATWDCRGGKGRGCELRENTTEWTDEFADRVLDSCDLCQGIGEFVVEVTANDTPWPEIELVEWLSN